MRILFLSNFYPPARPGGYTQWCYEVAEHLRACGHCIGVLTSRHELEKVPGGEQNIYRVLHLEGDLNNYQPIQFFTSWEKRYEANLTHSRQVISAFAPDLIFVWGMWAMSQGVVSLAEQMLPGRVVYYLSDYWPSAQDMHTTYWQKPARKLLMRFPKRILRTIAQAKLTRAGCAELRFEHVICVSKAVRDNLVEAGVPVENARIIHGGTDVARFSRAARHSRTYNQLRLLYAGQLVSHKGVHTAIEAMALLRNSQPPDRIRLTLIGSGHPQYETFLRDLVIRKNLQEYVLFRGALSRSEMPDALQQFDVLIFPSIYEEPLARMTQEAMVSGLVVVGTTTGGTNEILVEGENGLTFAAEDAACLAKQIARLAADSELCRRLAEAGRQTVLAKFTLERMITEIEEYLRNVAYDAYPVSHQLLPTL